MAKITKRFYFKKGDIPSDQVVSWWMEEDWNKHEEYIEKLKATGELGEEDYVDVTYDPDDFKIFTQHKEDPDNPTFSNYGMLIPQLDGSFIEIH